MTDDTMSLRNLLEKTADTDFLREMIGFTAQRLMQLEAESLTGAPHVPVPSTVSPIAMAIASATGRPAPAPSSRAFRSCARAATSPAASNRGGRQRRR
jgi:hypothetical protein